MKNMKNKAIPALAALTLMASCSEQPAPKALVLYYSQNGSTKSVAEEIQAQTGADICAFDVVQKYDGNFEETIQRCLKEREGGFVPELETLGCDLAGYDVVYLGYPVWFGTYAPPVKALLASGVLDGKTIVPFCTFGSGGLNTSVNDLKAALPGADIKTGYGVRAARVASAPEELNRFLIENGWKEGEVEALPEYSEMADVTEAEAAIFDKACSGYQFPLGTPVQAASRKLADGTDYVFIAEGVGPDGRTSRTKVFVTAADGKAPEFTQVVR